jgi:WD40-like Beta Propeller Repeat
MRRRRPVAAAAVAIAGAAAGALVAHAVGRSSARPPCPSPKLGSLVYARGGAYLKLDFRTCKTSPAARLPATRRTRSADGRYVFFFENRLHSASLAADGLPLRVRGGRTGRVQTVATTLPTPGFAAWCGNALLYVVNRGGREVTMGDGIASASPPAFRSRTILRAGTTTSWNTIACRPGGRAFAVAAGPAGPDSPFGREHRSLWLVSGGTPRRLTRPPAGTSDESPQWSSDGRWVAFVRTSARRVGTLYAYDLRTRRLIGPLASLGKTTNYYGTYGWANQTAWSR